MASLLPSAGGYFRSSAFAVMTGWGYRVSGLGYREGNDFIDRNPKYLRTLNPVPYTLYPIVYPEKISFDKAQIVCTLIYM
ncbi:MAG: hypothetical protein ACM33C_04780, partial [Syntrophaceae bacterium]